jgi:peptide/nickel transport system ATP-binding protein
MLQINNLSLDFMRYDSSFIKKNPLRIINDLNLHVKKGEITAIIGASGSGKSLLAHAVVGILPANVKQGGDVLFKGNPLTKERQKELRGKEIALIPQTVNFLNPLRTVGRQVYRSAWKNHGNRAEAVRSAAFVRYNLKESDRYLFPHEVSGGMARRILTAMATVTDATLIIADEPTTGLDGEAIEKTFASLRELAHEGKAVLVITHDIKRVLKFADSVAVFYGGTTVEVAQPEDFRSAENLRHPYTREIFSSMPENAFSFVPGYHPFGDMIHQGCIFYDRCSLKSEECSMGNPGITEINNGWVRCHHAVR